MSIRERVEEAELLWNSGRKEGAWTQAMIATAATARKRYPRPMGDRDSFTKYVQDITFTIISGNPKPPNLQNGNVLLKFGEHGNFEDILYKDYRCMLIHEGELGSSGLTESKFSDGEIIYTLVVGTDSQLPDHWVLNLLNAIRWSPENADEF